jgi:phosphoribosylglycinamide formyltransferase-1
MKRVAVMASGGGSNLGALLEYFESLPAPGAARVAVVVSNKEGSGALARAAERRIPGLLLSNPDDGAALTSALEQHGTDILVLAGYMKLVPMRTTVRYAGAIVNVHPALLPYHGGPGMYGMRVHRAVLARGETESGATVHFVDAQYDHGAPIAWGRVQVDAADTPETLAARVLAAEHFILPRVVHALAIGAVRLAGSGAVIVTNAAEPIFANPPAGIGLRLAG